MAFCRSYCRPATVDEALDALTGAAGVARVIAGGTDLLLDLQQGRHPPVDTLVDVTDIGELREIRVGPHGIFLGAAVTHAQLAEHPLVAAHAACLREASALIGGPQVRNVATIGGNVAHALPAADGTIALLALGSRAELATRQGRRRHDLEELFAGPGQTTFDRGAALLVGFHIPRQGIREGSAFRRVMRSQGVAIALLNLAVWLRLDPWGAIDEARLAVGPSGPTPKRARAAEAALRGQPSQEVDYACLMDALAQEVHLRASPHRATLEYRQRMLEVLLRRCLPAASKRASGVLAPTSEGAGE